MAGLVPAINAYQRRNATEDSQACDIGHDSRRRDSITAPSSRAKLPTGAIPKAAGDGRNLGIPFVADLVIQQATVQKSQE
jgi:retron-type reverse transcriptase